MRLMNLQYFNRLPRGIHALLSLLLSLSLLSCSTTHYQKKADDEAYKILEEKSQSVTGSEEKFSIDSSKDTDPLAGFPVVNENDPSLGAEMPPETGMHILSLEQAVIVATHHNRTYQNSRESVYLQALSLTLDRHRYAPIFSGGASANYNRSTRDVVLPSDFTQSIKAARGVAGELEQLTGTSAALIKAYTDVVESAGGLAGLDEPRTVIVDERSVTGDTQAGVDLLLKGGGRIALTLSSNFLRFLTGAPREDASSTLAASFSQPLLRGAGRAVNMERLTQSERNVLYAIRDYTQFRKQFAVDICNAYYGVLQQRDVVRNTWSGLQNSKSSFERQEAFAAEGLSTQSELGRLRQSYLDFKNRYTNSVSRYLEELDRFKILLGLPTNAPLMLDDGELTKLRDSGLLHPAISSEDAVRVAMASRLDYQNELDAVDDTERRVHVAENGLKPRLDMVAGAKVPSMPGNSYEKLDFKRMSWNVGLDIDPVFDRKALRNAYRTSLIEFESAKRKQSLAEDNIKLDVRGAWRDLDQAKRNYDVALESVKLSERRVEEQKLLAELGLATAKDQVDAQNDLIQSQNSLTAALVGHTIARLGFWRDMGLLHIKKDGLWEEISYDNAASSDTKTQ